MGGTDAAGTSCQEILLAAWLWNIEDLARLAGCRDFLRSLKDSFPEETRPGEVIRIINGLQKPENYDEWLVSAACRLSGGTGGRKTRVKPEQENAAFFDQALIHVISNLSLSENEKGVPAYCSLRAVDDYSSLPSTNTRIGKQEFQRLWQGFSGDFPALKGRSFHDFTLALDTLMERYFWCLPALPDPAGGISFYQQARVTAAFAGALYGYHRANRTETPGALNDEETQKFLFINGDISGIQKYIFDLKKPSENAKLLRARSFQLSMLSEIIAGYLSAQFGVSRDCVITSAGGKFLLLAPNTEEVRVKLGEERLLLERYFLREFAGSLCFVLADGVAAAGRDVREDRFRGLLNRIGTGAERAKQRKMQAALSAGGAVLNKLYNDLQYNGECEYCGTLPNEKAGKDRNLCRSCAGLVEIGGRLLHANGTRVILKTDTLAPFAEMVKITGKDDVSFGYTVNEYKAGYPLMFLPYTAPVQHEQPDVLKTFNEIAGLSRGSGKLAMFKADVDNLGLIFTSALGGNPSLPLYAELSRRLHCFFSGFPADFIRKNTEYRQKIYTVFSGGDDVCVLGAWDTVMRFALDFRNKFAEFANHNPSVTLSGGIALASPSLPVRNIAEEAEKALEASKARRNNTGDTIKDGVTVFGVTVDWKEYGQSLAGAEKILQYLDPKAGKVSSAVVYRMIDFANRAGNAGKGILRDMLWMSSYRYIIARNIKSEHKDAVEFFQGFGTSPEAMKKSRIAASFALYANRNYEEGNNA
ncbi:MAG: type III-A CRISPR-associated protein Cas10/Csm1 [Treponema sp.]|jgi:CRISPR-associated protein Csm1|nr:type III-A CRISPR-associated protein Cas10/Csm1 [Treponema sp.]